MKPSTYYFHMKANMLTCFQICISLPLTLKAIFRVHTSKSNTSLKISKKKTNVMQHFKAQILMASKLIRAIKSYNFLQRFVKKSMPLIERKIIDTRHVHCQNCQRWVPKCTANFTVFSKIFGFVWTLNFRFSCNFSAFVAVLLFFSLLLFSKSYFFQWQYHSSTMLQKSVQFHY